MLCEADGHWCSYFGEAIEDCSTDFELGNLTIEGAGDNALTEELEAVHFGLDQTAAMVATPLFPVGATEPLCCAQRFIARIDAGAVLCPWSAVAADRETASAPRSAMAA
jgi:hypothetical protein